METSTALEIVNYMDLTKGHTLTEDEAMAIDHILAMAFSLRQIQAALNIESVAV